MRSPSWQCNAPSLAQVAASRARVTVQATRLALSRLRYPAWHHFSSTLACCVYLLATLAHVSVQPGTQDPNLSRVAELSQAWGCCTPSWRRALPAWCGCPLMDPGWLHCTKAGGTDASLDLVLASPPPLSQCDLRCLGTRGPFLLWPEFGPGNSSQFEPRR